MIKHLFDDFDFGLNKILEQDNIYSEYNLLLKAIATDSEIKELQAKQKEIQFLILNLEQMNKTEFIKHYLEELNKIDKQLMTNKLLIKQAKLKMMIDLDQQIIKNEFEKLKME